MTRDTITHDRGAETFRMPDGSGYALTIADYGAERTVTLMRVTADNEYTTIHQHVDQIPGAGDPRGAAYDYTMPGEIG